MTLPVDEAAVSDVPAVVLVTSSFPIQGDGSEAAGAFVADLAEEMATRFPVRVVAPGRDNSQEEWAPAVEVFRYKTPKQPLSTLKLWHPMGAAKVVQVMRGGAAATERAMQAGAVAHVVALWALPCGEWARRSAKRHGVGYSVWTLGSDIWSLGRIPVVRSRLRTILRDARQCWSDGLKLADDTRAIAGRPVGFLPSTRRTTSFRSEAPRHQAPYRLLFLGRWHFNKGIDLLLQSLHWLEDEDWRMIERVDIYGGGPLESLVSRGVAKLREAGRPVNKHGYVDKQRAESAIMSADYLLIPSRVESIPVVFSDAMKLGCPVISMPVGDLPMLMQGEKSCGVLSVAVDAESLGNALRVALRLSASSFDDDLRAMSRRFDLSACAHTLLSDFSAGGANAR